MTRIQRFGLMLGEVGHVNVVPERARTFERFGPVDNPRKRGLARTVSSYQRDRVATFNGERARVLEVFDLSFVGDIGLGEGRQVEHDLARTSRLREANRNRSFIRRRRRESLESVERLDTTLYLTRLCCLRA